MNRNTELHMGNIPKINAKRSRIDRSNSIKTTWNNGKCIPFWWDEVYPADTVEIDMSGIIRMATPITPVMDDMYMDVYFFFVPSRLVWKHWKEFWGENDNPWYNSIEYEIPQIEAPTGGWERHTIADYMNIPTYVDDISVNALPLRAYAKIMSDWFRSENLEYVCHMYDDDTTRTGSNGDNYVTDIELGGQPYTANKIADYYTRCLPAPQKGPDVAIPIGTKAPIIGDINISVSTNQSDINVFAGSIQRTLQDKEKNTLIYEPSTPLTPGQSYNNNLYINQSTNNAYQTIGDINTNGVNGYTYPNNLYASIPGEDPSTIIEANALGINQLYADLSDATASTINELRTAFAIQKFYEAQARGGSRYIEFCKNIFGVTSSDARMQRSEYIGGTRIKLNMETILQTSSTDTTTPQGNPAGYSCTMMNKSMFTKSFEEHGFIIGILLTRTEHTYQQGLEKKWTRKKWTDYYNPFFANLGEQPVYNENIYLTTNSTPGHYNPDIPQNKEVFGYQEAWAELRYSPNIATGDFRSNSPQGSIDIWTYIDDYEALPELSEEWLREPTTNVDRTLAVQSSISHQMWGDLYLKQYWTRNIPIYSMPGLIDHV